MSIAQFIDHTILKPTTRLSDIRQVCEEAKQYNFAAVCVPPYYVRDARQILDGHLSKVATVIGFPFGYSHFKAKETEATQAIWDGAQELDVVMNLAAFKSNDLAWLESEIDALVHLAGEKDVAVKVIIESGILTEAEIVRCCEIYRHFPIRYLKTSTGYAEKGATLEAVQLMRANLPESIGIKASGGIRDHAFAQALVEAGATRLGCSASVAIVEGTTGNDHY